MKKSMEKIKTPIIIEKDSSFYSHHIFTNCTIVTLFYILIVRVNNVCVYVVNKWQSYFEDSKSDMVR